MKGGRREGGRRRDGRIYANAARCVGLGLGREKCVGKAYGAEGLGGFCRTACAWIHGRAIRKGFGDRAVVGHQGDKDDEP